VSAGLLLALRLLLAAVFALAAGAKLAGRTNLRETAVGFGLPRPFSPVAVLLPVVELAVAAMLVPARTAWLGALGAVVLLAVFTAAIAAQLARGRRPECNCFGTVHAKPIGRATLARNALLLGCAAALVASGRDAGPSATAWLGEPVRAAVAGLGLLALAQAVLLAVVLRRYGRVLVRLDALEKDGGLRIGAAAPDFALPDLDGERVALTDLRAPALPILLLFSHPACGPCAALLPEVARWQQEHVGDLVVAVVSSGDLEDDRARAAEHGLTLVLRDDGDHVADEYGVTGTPMALLVDADGRVASKLVVGADAIGALVASVVAAPLAEDVLVGV